MRVVVWGCLNEGSWLIEIGEVVLVEVNRFGDLVGLRCSREWGIRWDLDPFFFCWNEEERVRKLRDGGRIGDGEKKLEKISEALFFCC